MNNRPCRVPPHDLKNTAMWRLLDGPGVSLDRSMVLNMSKV